MRPLRLRRCRTWKESKPARDSSALEGVGGTGLDAEKKVTWGGGFGTGQDTKNKNKKQVRSTHLLRWDCLGHGKMGASNRGQQVVSTR